MKKGAAEGMSEMIAQFPQVLLLGNGLNRVYGGDDWNNYISKMRCNSKVDVKTLQSLPFPLQAVLATGDTIQTSIMKKQSLFYGAEEVKAVSRLIQQLLDI